MFESGSKANSERLFHQGARSRVVDLTEFRRTRPGADDETREPREQAFRFGPRSLSARNVAHRERMLAHLSAGGRQS